MRCLARPRGRRHEHGAQHATSSRHQNLHDQRRGSGWNLNPRHFATEPTKKFTYVLHSRSDNVTIFKIDRGTGTFSFTDQYVGVGNPSQIVFLTV
jgi:6-phosphogluconolactonase (cycloisomerase 2 family)